MAKKPSLPRLYPVFFLLEKKKVVVVGGGQAALQKIRGLMGCGARVCVIARSPSKAIKALARKKKIALSQRFFRPEDLSDAHLVFAATSDREANQLVYEACRKHRVLVNVVDTPDLCDFYAASTISRSGITVALSTSGQSPGLSKFLRKRWSKEMQAASQYACALASFRRKLKKIEEPKKRLKAMRALVDEEIFRLFLLGEKEKGRLALEKKFYALCRDLRLTLE